MKIRNVWLFLLLAASLYWASPLCAAEGGEERLNAFLRQFYSAWAKQDLKTITRLWHPESIYLQPRLAEMQSAWREKKFTFTPPVILQVENRNWGVILKTSVEVTIQNRKSRKTLKLPLTREFTLQKKNQDWLLWNYPSAEEDLADLILFLPETEKRSLLEMEKNAFTPQMIQSLLFHASSQRNANDFSKAKGTYHLAASLADEIKDPRGEAIACAGLGDIHRLHGPYEAAKGYYQKALLLFQSLSDHKECGTVYLNLAKGELAGTRLDQALELLGKALQELELAKDTPAQAEVLENMGNIFYDRGEYSRAAEFYQKNMDLDLKGGNASALLNLGNSYLALHKTEEALRAFLAALPQVAQIQDTAALAQVHTGLGHIYFEQKKLSSAMGHYRQAAEFWNELENKEEQALACERLGYVQYEMRDYASAEESFHQQLKIQQALDKPMGVAGAQSNLGMVCLVQQKYEQALSHYQAALTIFEQRKDVIGMLGALQNIGRVCYELADYSKALDFYEKGKKLAESSQNKSALSNLLLGIGLVKVLFGQYDIALEYFNQSMTLAEELGDKSNLAAMQHNIGLVYANQSHFRLALEYYEKSLALSEQLQDKASAAQTLGNIGLVLNAMGDSKPAIEREEKALALWEELKEREGKAKVLGYLGSIYYGNSQFDSALDYFQRGLAEWEVLADKMAISGTLSFIGDTHFRKKQLPQALDPYEKSLKIQQEYDNREAIAALECGIANVQLAMNQPEKALEMAEHAAEMANQLHHSDILWYARFKTGQAHRQLKNSEPAERSLMESIRLIEDLRAEVGNEQNRIRFLDGRTAPLLVLFELKVEQGKFWEALALAEKARLWQMDELLGAHGRYNPQGLSDHEQLQEQQLRSQVFTWRTQLAKARQHDPGNNARIQELEQKHQQAQAAYAAQEKGLFAAHPDLAFLRLRAEPFSQARLRHWNIPPGQLVLEFVVTERKIFLACLAKSTAAGNLKSGSETGKASSLPAWDLKIIPLENPPAHLGDELLTYREMLRTQTDSYAPKALELFTFLLGPVQAWMQGKKQLLVVPDGVLWLCPFQALVTPEGKFLIQNAAISYAPSLDIAVQMAQMQQSGKQPAERISLTQLSATKPDNLSLQRFRDLQEADHPTAASSLSSSGRGESKVSYSSKDKRLTGAGAIKQALQTPLPVGSLLELATPAVLDDYNPLYSFLLLSPPAGSDEEAESFLEAWEIVKLSWPARAVLLPESIRPVKRVKAGEGLQAWSWALLSAGAPAGLIRQWETGPASSEALRNEILPPLRGLPNRQARLEGSEALRRCILKWLQTPGQAHPGVWAAYQWLGCGF